VLLWSVVAFTNPLPEPLLNKRYEGLTHWHHHFVEMPPRARAGAGGRRKARDAPCRPSPLAGKELVRAGFIIRLVLPVLKEVAVAEAELIDLTIQEAGGTRRLMKLLVTPEEAADLLSIGRSKLYELLAAGVVESVRVGTCRRIPVQALEDFVSRLRQAG